MNDLSAIKGIGPKTEKYLNNLSIFTKNDLLYYFPRDYEKIENVINISSIEVGKIAAVSAIVLTNPLIYKKGRMTIVETWLDDGTSRIKAYWFNLPFIKANLKVGKRFVFRGKVAMTRNGYAFSQCKMYSIETYQKMIGKLLPIYGTTKGLTSNTIKKMINNALNDEDTFSNDIKEFLPKEYLIDRKLCDLKYAISHMHNPIDFDDVVYARRRIVYDEFFIFALAIIKSKNSNKIICKNELRELDDSFFDNIIKRIPFELTLGQKNAINDIVSDLKNGKKVNRLVEGDVGSGKTIVALIISLLCINKKVQVAFMAPTEVLAMQHYENVVKLFGDMINVSILTGSTKKRERDKILLDLSNGNIDMLIGTHALFSNDVIYKNLGLCIIDEQHKFGVNQRKALEDKGKDVGVIVMSATPIPRTLAMLLYANFDISLIKDKPKNRKPIKNCVIGVEDREKAYKAIKKEIDKGNSAYVICASIEKNDDDIGSFANYENVIDYKQKLEKYYGNSVKVGLLHGKMKQNEKNEIMNSFKNGDIDILVSTTVVEVGVDVSNATFIMIEDAGAFGLSELHQLRGRVGRSENQSYALFVDTYKTEKSIERLSILNESNDGFYIAEEDLKLRGPGDIFGVKQSGDVEFNVADVYTDANVLKMAMEDANKFINDNMVMSKTIEEKLNIYLSKGYVI